MQSPAKASLMLMLIVAVLAGGCCRPDSLVGLWQTETTRQTFPGQTNTVEALETVEFLKDRSFKIKDVITLNGDRRTNVSFSGTYTMVGTNQVRLEITADNIAFPTNRQAPLTISCSIVADTLELPKFITSVVPEYRKFRRAK